MVVYRCENFRRSHNRRSSIIIAGSCKPRCLLPFFTFTSILCKHCFLLLRKKKKEKRKEKILQENIKCLIALSAPYAPVCKRKMIRGVKFMFKNIREIYYDGTDMTLVSPKTVYQKRIMGQRRNLKSFAGISKFHSK